MGRVYGMRRLDTRRGGGILPLVTAGEGGMDTPPREEESQVPTQPWAPPPFASARVASTRERLRDQRRGRHYSGVVHFAFVNAIGLGVIGFALSLLTNVSAAEWATLPLTLAAAFLSWYGAH